MQAPAAVGNDLLPGIRRPCRLT